MSRMRFVGLEAHYYPYLHDICEQNPSLAIDYQSSPIVVLMINIVILWNSD